MAGRTLAMNAILVALLLYFFGHQIYFWSGDFATHYMVVDQIMKHGTTVASHVAGMQYYPAGSYWITAALGRTIGSGLTAMCYIWVLSTYVSYLSIAYLASTEGGSAGKLLVVAFLLLAAPSFGIIGFEVVNNLFYPQLVASAVYLVVLVALVMIGYRYVYARVAFVLLSSALLFWIHAVPAVHLLAAFSIALLFEFLSDAIRTRRIDFKIVTALLLAVIGGAALLAFHPSVAVMREISRNNGRLDFGYSNASLISFAIFSFVVTGVSVLRKTLARLPISPADLIVSSALSAAVLVTLLQYLALIATGEGSPYAVKKHAFLLISLAILALARWIAVNVSLRTKMLPVRLLRSPYVTACAAAAVCIFIFYRPATPLAPTLNAVAYAEGAVKRGLPGFKPESTVAIADSLPSVIRLLITETTFLSPFSGIQTVRLFDNTLVPERESSLAMVDRNQKNASECRERFEPTDQFMIVPSSCLSFPPGIVSFAKGAKGSSLLSGDWAEQEDWGVYSKAGPALVTFGIPVEMRGHVLEMRLTARASVSIGKPALTVDIAVNDQHLDRWVFSASQEARTLHIPANLTNSSMIKVSFHALDAASPSSVAYNSDIKVSGIGIETLRLHTIETSAADY